MTNGSAIVPEIIIEGTFDNSWPPAALTRRPFRRSSRRNFRAAPLPRIRPRRILFRRPAYPGRQRSVVPDHAALARATVRW